MSKFVKDNALLAEEQNGFRRDCSIVDHLNSLTAILETRKLKKQSTFAAYIDFTKACDCIPRDYLFRKLEQQGIKGRMLYALKALYDDNYSSVRVNGLLSGGFNVEQGVKKGCLISSLLFNMYINYLADSLNSLSKGVQSRCLCTLMI